MWTVFYANDYYHGSQGGDIMNQNQKSDNSACVEYCEKRFRECLLSGNDEVYCRIQRVPCDSGCSDES